MTEPLQPDPILIEAIAWVVRVNDPAFGDWEAFEQWLARSPAHADAYHAAAIDEADMAAVIAYSPAPEPIEMPEERSRRWPVWAGAALAASLLAVVGYGSLAPPPAPRVFETAAGVQRTIALDDGSQVVMNGGTRLVADGKDPRSLTLDHGEALFTVRHDESRPFRVAVGTASVVDIGTRFDIVRERDATQVAVSEGSVDWRRNGNSVRVPSGRRLRAQDGSADVELASVTPESVGGWSQGQLVYDGTALAAVAADLSRTLGATVTVAPAIQTRPVRGVIRLNGGADMVVPRLAALLGIQARRDDQGWRLAASP